MVPGRIDDRDRHLGVTFQDAGGGCDARSSASDDDDVVEAERRSRQRSQRFLHPVRIGIGRLARHDRDMGERKAVFFGDPGHLVCARLSLLLAIWPARNDRAKPRLCGGSDIIPGELGSSREGRCDLLEGHVMSPVRSRRTAWDECEAVDGCAERHCSGEEQRGGRLDRERGDGGAGAQADKAPAYAEQGGTAEEARVDRRRGRRMELLRDDRRRASTHDEPGYRHRQDRSRHDECQGRVPGTGDVEKRPYPRRIDHAGHGEAGAEQRAADERKKALAHHDTTPARRMRVTVAMPVAMNVPVATMDRGDRRDRPQTPPATAISPSDVGKRASTFTLAAVSAAPRGSPAVKSKAIIQGAPPSERARTRANMPLTPAMRPLPSNMIAAANPIIRPPMKPASGMAWGNPGITAYPVES
ncbi:hypothetical protein WR25_25576 [Diploscapter pachys]|uniref:Uncharacterized protein n=1 Tax=Diploscapter pachys TaxID=2018661 RepID=A0A2A2JWF5_9BILA|nr:hypothetical protein WR25_25576 [Diploscapter pachys]